MSDSTPLPYTDTKKQGAADFYYAIQATFAFIQRKFGHEGLIRYWRDLGERYMRPVWRRWREQGLSGIASYWTAFFEAEPGSQVKVETTDTEVILKVEVCPAIQHLRAGGRTIIAEFCQHCYFVNEAAAAQAGFTVRVCGGNGRCVQRFMPRTETIEPQNMEEIARC